MSELIAVFPDGSKLEFAQGRFDQWCMYLTPKCGRSSAPRDEEYFAALSGLAQRHGRDLIYGDFVTIYDAVQRHVDDELLTAIYRRSKQYGSDALLFQVTMTTLYAGMIAEENRSDVPLRKRLKRLGVHQLLYREMSATLAANYSRNRPAWLLRQECRRYGF